MTCGNIDEIDCCPSEAPELGCETLRIVYIKKDQIHVRSVIYSISLNPMKFTISMVVIKNIMLNWDHSQMNVIIEETSYSSKLTS